MTCVEVEPYVSVLFDGEPVPLEAASHINLCPSCRDRLHAYAEIGAEIRLMASATEPVSVVPKELLIRMHSRRHNWLNFLRGRILMPRFAIVAMALAALAIIPAGWTLVHAQGKPLWFQFQLGPQTPQQNQQFNVAKAGFDDRIAWVFIPENKALPAGSGQVTVNLIAAHVAVRSIQNESVKVALAARNFAQAHVFSRTMQQQLSNLPMQEFSYIPNQTLSIPVDGGGTLTMRGEVVDHQPKFAWGFPVEPYPDQLVLRSPILLEGDRVVANQPGGITMADGASQAVVPSPGLGKFSFSLQKLPGSVEAKANWSYLTFKLGTKHYQLTSGSQICGGDQPRTVWVSFEPHP
jgi:hypothetical protein